MPVYESKRRSASGERVHRVVVYHDGRPHETTATGTKRHAREVERALADKLARAPREPQEKREAPVLLTFSRGEYAIHAKAHLGAETWKVRRHQLARLCEAHTYESGGAEVAVDLGALRLTEVTTERLEGYKAARTAEGAKPGTVNTELAKLQAVLTYARSLELSVASPKVRLLPVRGRGRVKFWTRAQVAALLTAVERETPELYGLVLFLALTGCRKGEALACETAWIDLERDVLRIEPNAAWQPKSGEPREVPIEAQLRPWLERAKRAGRRYAFVAAKRSKGRNEVTRWACWPRRRWEKALRAAGLIDDLSEDSKGPHRLRHTYASLFLAAGGSMFTLSRILGHASIRTTESTYAHVMAEHVEAARGLVNLGQAAGPATMEARRRWAT